MDMNLIIPVTLEQILVTNIMSTRVIFLIIIL